MGFAMVIGFTEHLEYVTTSSCNSFMGLHSLQITALQQTYSLPHLHRALPSNGYQQCRFLSSLTHDLTSWQLSCASLWPQLAGFCLENCCRSLVSQSVKLLLLAFASTVIPGFSLLEIHDKDFHSLLNMYMF
jgi:hypothetical protein